MNLGGEPDRDDSGLPPVDVEIPDDARELDRDVQAYYREQRALRRHLRRRRWSAPLTRDGLIVPMLAGCLILALIAGTLLTVFTAWPGNLGGAPQSPGTPAGTPSSAESAGSSPGASATASTAPGATAVTPAPALPTDAVLTIGARRLGLRGLHASVLALVPAPCACATALRRLLGQAAQTHVPVFLVGTGSAMATVRRLATGTRPSRVQVAEDAHDVLGSTYHPSGLTAVLVGASGSVSLARRLDSRLQLTSEFRTLAAGASPAP